MKAFPFNFLRKKILVLGTSLLLVLFLFFCNTPIVFASISTELASSESTVIEYLKLNVPKQNRQAWLSAEKQSWEPWLKKQKGFLNRKLLWDPNSEEAILLISWDSRAAWKSIPQKEIDTVQQLFENIAKDLTAQSDINPFPVKYESELIPQ
ncbi:MULTISPECIES: TIGR03792 family protein [unclassified Prochlorococcus]|uniref:TIGR03792 family protein n=1 Tax=unclassified Prochlorococcus TaxID=2627481 RepID=UPI00053379BA|nr:MULTISPECIES: TIGR03792 family protein [unclassified Prochlorococcus]KGG16292.1 hypothetical protein EV07_1461 [Prochlorococcus sp. MIT 0603]KGG17974.1 hypothetical protein EV06_0097 [Prochlorococcus sp. MIT 0602]